MHKFKRMFAEFKSIFVSENLLQENEEHANIVTASTMLNVFWLNMIVFLLTYFSVFKIGMNTMSTLTSRCIILLAVPSIICYAVKGKGKWVKNLLFLCFTILLAMADALLKYNATLIMVLPIILSARYYNKYFTIGVATLTTILFSISTFMSVKIGQQDINSYNLIIPEGTTITVTDTLRDAVVKVNVDESQRLRNIFLHFFLPKFFLFNIVSFACVQIAQSGKNMIIRQKEISDKGARIETELNLAKVIQKSMLPSIFPPFPEHKEFDIYASMTPAKEVGGDFYDMFLIDNDHLAICMADVSGKGIPASLVMMVSKILIKNVTMIDLEVDKALTRVNKMLCDGNQTGMFVTCWFGILDLKNGNLEFANAGHNPPLIYSKNSGKFEYLKSKPNMVLAGFDTTLYRKNKVKLEQGDKLFLYTDGVTEATNSKNELYGEDRLNEFLNAHTDLDVKDTITNLKSSIDSFVGEAEQFDDITMLEVYYKGHNKDLDETQREFVADVNELSNVQNYVEQFLSKHNCKTNTLMQISLVVEEIFVNIAKYAYKDKEGSCLLKLEFCDNNVTLTFCDTGIPFNPLEKENPDISKPASEREIGGLGIFITKKIIDDISYEYANDNNVLKIVKKI